MGASPNRDTIEVASLVLCLERLAAAPGPIPHGTLATMLQSMALSIADLTKWISFDPTIYARNRVALFPHAEVLVMCWQSGQLTPIHDHKGSACAVRVVKGVATEISYKRSNCGTLVPCSHDRYVERDVMHSFDDDVHQMGNLETAGRNLITLHTYSPPLTGMQLFGEESTFFNGYDSLLHQVIDRVRRSQANEGTIE